DVPFADSDSFVSSSSEVLSSSESSSDSLERGSYIQAKDETVLFNFSPSVTWRTRNQNLTFMSMLLLHYNLCFLLRIRILSIEQCA
ncbi:hypothetical protein L195_g059921, partial [Trifolium pratense]